MRLQLLFYILISISSIHTVKVVAQNTVDTVYMINGELKEGKVTKIHESTIDFVYSGEELSYELNKAEVEKITFASGRTEVFNTAPTTTSATDKTSVPQARKNKLAVLPFTMISNDQGLMSEAMSGQIQSAAVNSFKENTNQIIVQEAMTTNAILLQNGLDPVSIKAMLPKDIAVLLEVEFVVYGSANIDFDSTRTSGLSSTTYKDKKNTNKKSGSELTSNSSTTRTNYNTTIALNILSDTGSTLYSVNRNGFGTSLDTYSGTLNYLIKRCPWGTKRK